MSLVIQNLGVTAGSFSLSHISLEIPDGKCAVLMGRSGIGKTTIMEALCGLRKVSGGSIVLGGVDVTDLRPAERSIGLVPQDTSLFPHLTVREHLEFGPRLHKWPKQEMKERVDSLAGLLDLTGLLDRKPRGLSGGEGKRVALGRAIAVRPRLLCTDEALSGLDGETHGAVMKLLRGVIREERLTVLHITHRKDEAKGLGDLIYKVERKEGGGLLVAIQEDDMAKDNVVE